MFNSNARGLQLNLLLSSSSQQSLIQQIWIFLISNVETAIILQFYEKHKQPCFSHHNVIKVIMLLFKVTTIEVYGSVLQISHLA